MGVKPPPRFSRPTIASYVAPLKTYMWGACAPHAPHEGAWGEPPPHNARPHAAHELTHRVHGAVDQRLCRFLVRISAPHRRARECNNLHFPRPRNSASSMRSFPARKPKKGADAPERACHTRIGKERSRFGQKKGAERARGARTRKMRPRERT